MGDGPRISYGVSKRYKETGIHVQRGRSLAWIRRQPPELVLPGSNPGGPATQSVWLQFKRADTDYLPNRGIYHANCGKY